MIVFVMIIVFAILVGIAIVIADYILVRPLANDIAVKQCNSRGYKYYASYDRLPLSTEILALTCTDEVDVFSLGIK